MARKPLTSAPAEPIEPLQLAIDDNVTSGETSPQVLATPDEKRGQGVTVIDGSIDHATIGLIYEDRLQMKSAALPGQTANVVSEDIISERYSLMADGTFTAQAVDLRQDGVDPAILGPKLIIKGPTKGRWRAGRHFGPEIVTIPAAEFTQSQIEALLGDPELAVLVG